MSARVNKNKQNTPKYLQILSLTMEPHPFNVQTNTHIPPKPHHPQPQFLNGQHRKHPKNPPRISVQFQPIVRHCSKNKGVHPPAAAAGAYGVCSGGAWQFCMHCRAAAKLLNARMHSGCCVSRSVIATMRPTVRRNVLEMREYSLGCVCAF